jgi:hypothetical protein
MVLGRSSLHGKPAQTILSLVNADLADVNSAVILLKSGWRKHGAVARQFQNVHLMRRRKAAEFAKRDSDVTLGRIGSRIGLPWLLK